MTTRRVLFLTPSNKLFGARRSLLTTVSNLPAPWEPHVVCPGTGELQQELARLGLNHHVIRHYNWRKGKFLLHRYWEVRQLRRLFEQLQPALVVANEYFSMPYAVRMVGESGAPVIAYSRLTISERHIRNYELARADLIICVSRAAAEDFRGQPWFDEKVRVLHNAVDVAALELPEPEQAAARRAFRAEIGLGEGDFLIGMAGLISERKRQETAIRALRLLHDRGAGGMKMNVGAGGTEASSDGAAGTGAAHLVIVGRPRPEDEPYERRMRQMAADLDVGPFVHWAGFRDDMRRVYPAFDANLLLSDEEGFGRVIIEAGVFGVPSIGTRVGGIPEIIRTADTHAPAESGAALESASPTGALIPLDDPAALADTLSSWMADPSLRARLGTAAARHARDEFSIPRHIAQLTAHFDQAMDKYEHCW